MEETPEEVQEPSEFEKMEILSMSFSVNEDGELITDIVFKGKKLEGE